MEENESPAEGSAVVTSEHDFWVIEQFVTSKIKNETHLCQLKLPESTAIKQLWVLAVSKGKPEEMPHCLTALITVKFTKICFFKLTVFILHKINCILNYTVIQQNHLFKNAPITTLTQRRRSVVFAS